MQECSLPAAPFQPLEHLVFSHEYALHCLHHGHCLFSHEYALLFKLITLPHAYLFCTAGGGAGPYSAVGFSYGGATAAAADDDGDDSSSSSDSDSDSEGAEDQETLAEVCVCV